MTMQSSPHTTTADQTRDTRVAWIVWGTLAVVTAVGGVLTDAGNGGTVIIALIALFGLAKCWLIVQYFMEVRHAPRWLQIVTTAWMVVLWLTLAVLFLRA